MRYHPQRSRRRNKLARPCVEWLETRQLLATLTVNSTADGSPPPDVLTLREAIELVDGAISLSTLTSQAQAQVSGSLSDPNTIAFDIPGPGVHTIAPSSVLPPITAPLTINGYTQPGASPNTLAVGDNAVLLIELDGENAGVDANDPAGLTVYGRNTTIEGLAINRFNEAGIEIGASGVSVQGDFIGSDATGTIDRGNAVLGIWITSGENDVIGGVDLAARNVISANKGANIQSGGGLGIPSGLIIQGNYIGTDASGMKSLITPTHQSSGGVDIGDTMDALIGGVVPNAGNVISGNQGDALYINASASFGSTNALVQGNLIGTDATGTKPVPNAADGIDLFSSGNTIGGTTPAARNIIAASSPFYGMGILGSNNLIEGNFIGTGINGTEAMGNGGGMYIQDATGNTIGGTVAGAANVIANSLYQGLALDAGAVNNLVLTNSITNNAQGGISDYAKNGGNAPSIELAVAERTSIRIVGSLDNKPNATFTVQYFANTTLDAASQAEGQRYLGSSVLTTNANGQVNFDVTLPLTISPGEWVTATASTPGQNTTVFSAGVQAVSGANHTTLAVLPIESPAERVYAFVLTAAVTPTETSTEPTGSMIFKDGSTVLGSVPLSAVGRASLTTGILPAGTHRFTATYSGDGTFDSSLSTLVQAVSQDVPPTLVTAQRGQIRGRSTVALMFSEPMSSASLGNIGNYQVVSLRKGRIVSGRPLRVRLALVSGSTGGVTLVLAQRLAPRLSYQLTVRGTSPGGVANAGETLLNGNGSGVPGTDAVFVLPSLVRPRSSHSRHQ